MGEIEKLKLRLKNQKLAPLATHAGVGRATIYRFVKDGKGSIVALDKINKALDDFGVKRINDQLGAGE